MSNIEEHEQDIINEIKRERHFEAQETYKGLLWEEFEMGITDQEIEAEAKASDCHYEEAKEILFNEYCLNRN